MKAPDKIYLHPTVKGEVGASWLTFPLTDEDKDFEGNTPEEAIDKASNWFHSTFCNS